MGRYVEKVRAMRRVHAEARADYERTGGTVPWPDLPAPTRWRYMENVLRRKAARKLP